MRLLSIAIVASCLAQSVVAEVPNKYLSVGLLSVVCQNEAKKADQDFYVFSKEGDSWISVVGNVTSIHETAEGFTLQLSNSPHETSFLKRTNEGFNLVSFKKGEISKKVCTDLTLLSAEIKSAMLSVANEAYAGERQSASNKIESLRADVLALQEQNAEQNDVLAELSARSETDRITASNTIESLRADLLVRQSQSASQKENLAALNERYDEDRKIASDTIENLKVENYEQGQTISRSIEAIRLLEISLSNSQDALEKISEFQSQPNGEAVGELSLNIDLYSQALTNALQNVSELGPEFKKLELVFGQEAQLLELQSKTADQQVALSDLTARYDGLSATSTATIENLQDEARHLQAKINALETHLEFLNAANGEYKSSSFEATQAIAELRSELAKTSSDMTEQINGMDLAIDQAFDDIKMAQTEQTVQVSQKIDQTLATKLDGIIDELDARISLLNGELAMATTDNIDSALKEQAMLFSEVTTEFIAVVREGLNQDDPQAERKMQALMDTQSKLEERIGELNMRLLKASQRPKPAQTKRQQAERAPSQDVIKFP
jgi:chromosome segregation ATPase